jgi:hypothetical protein
MIQSKDTNTTLGNGFSKNNGFHTGSSRMGNAPGWVQHAPLEVASPDFHSDDSDDSNMQIDSPPVIEKDTKNSLNSGLGKAQINSPKEETTKKEEAQNLNANKVVQDQEDTQQLPNGHQIVHNEVEEADKLNPEEGSSNNTNNQSPDLDPESYNYVGELEKKAIEQGKILIRDARDSTELEKKEEPKSEQKASEEAFELLKRLRKLVSNPGSELKNKNLITINSISKVIESYKSSSTTRVKQIEAEECWDGINGKRFSILEAEKKAFLSPKIFSLWGNNSQNGSKFKSSKSKAAASILKSRSVVSALFGGVKPLCSLNKDIK